MNLFEHRGVRTSFVSTQQQLDTIGQIRYESYLEVHAISENKAKSLKDAYDGQPNTINHYASAHGEIIGAIRTC